MISRIGSLLAGAAFLLASVSQAATGYSVSPPVLGYVFDLEGGALHRVNGLPGASSVGDPIDLGFVVSRTSIAPNQHFAIVWDEAGQASFVHLASEPPKLTKLEGAMEGALAAMISPSARHASLYRPDSGQIQHLAGLPHAPTVGQTVQLHAGDGRWTAFAVSDSGVIVAATARPDGSGSLFMLDPGQGPVRIGGVQRVDDLAFFVGSNDAIVTDGGASEVILYRDVVARRQTSIIASANDNLNNPFRAKPTSDGRFVAVAVSGGVASIPLMGGAPVFTECACAPTSLESLAGGNVFRLTDGVREPMQIAEVGASSRVLFVPALPLEDDATQ